MSHSKQNRNGTQQNQKQRLKSNKQTKREYEDDWTKRTQRNTKSDENGIWKFIIKKNDYSNEEISIKAKINDETLILTYNENEIQKRFKKTNFEFYDDRIIVQKGNSLWRIARKTLGGGVFYTEIYKNNLRKIKNPNLIYPGQVFNIPNKRKKKFYE